MFNIPIRQFAPEIQANQRHGTPADVWGLGYLATQLIDHLSIVQDSEMFVALRELVASMMQTEQDARPTM